MHHSSVGESPDAIDGEAHVRATGSVAESNTDIISTRAAKGSRVSEPEVTTIDKQSTDRRYSNGMGKWRVEMDGRMVGETSGRLVVGGRLGPPRFWATFDLSMRTAST